MAPVYASWRATESGRRKTYAWRRPNPRGWVLAPVGWAVLGLALWLSRGESPSTPVELAAAIGFTGLAMVVISGLVISGSHQFWPYFPTFAGVFAVLITVVDGELPAPRIVCVLIAVAIPGIAFLSGRAQCGRLPYRFNEPPVVRNSELPRADYGDWSIHPASGLLDAPVVLLTRWWNRADFTLAGLDGQVIAQVREIPHPRVDDGMRAAFDFRNMVAPRYVIEVADPNGRTLFFIDAAERQTDASVPNGAGFARSTAIVRPSGRQWAREGGMFFGQVYADVMGDARFSLDENLYEWGRSSLIAGEDGVFPCAHACRVPLGKNRRLPYYTLLDADGTAFAQLDYAGGSPKVRRLVRFRDKTPVAMRIAAIGSMIILGAEQRTDVLPPDPKAPEPYPGFANIHLPHYRRLRAFMDKTIAEYQR